MKSPIERMQSGLVSAMKSQVAKMFGPGGANTKDGKRHCLCGCGRNWENLNDNRVWFEPKCGRSAHTVKFAVRDLRRDLG